MFSFFGGGLGGNPETDGLNHANNPISMATNPRPPRFWKPPIRCSSGNGRSGPTAPCAGGIAAAVGAIYEIELLAQSADVALLGERGRHAPFGVAGGGPGALNRFVFDTDEGPQEPPMASKITGVS